MCCIENERLHTQKTLDFLSLLSSTFLLPFIMFSLTVHSLAPVRGAFPWQGTPVTEEGPSLNGVAKEGRFGPCLAFPAIL